MIRILCMATALALLATQAAADTRIRTEEYDANRVYDVYTQVGTETMIQLEQDERLSGTKNGSDLLGMGQGLAWTLSVRGNNVTFKPKVKKPDTNLLIVTNKRTYAFDLRDVPKDQAPTYILRFTYADTAAAIRAADFARAEVERKQAADQAAAVARDKGALNTDYFWRGENAMLKPTAAWDDGRFTRLVYDHAGELPVFYKVMPDGTEAIVNWHMDSDQRNTVVIHEVIRTVRARIGDQVIEVVNGSYKLPAFNASGTSVPGLKRTDKGGSL